MKFLNRSANLGPKSFSCSIINHNKYANLIKFEEVDFNINEI